MDALVRLVAITACWSDEGVQPTFRISENRKTNVQDRKPDVIMRSPLVSPPETTMKYGLTLLTVCITAVASLHAAEPDKKGLDFFESKIRPLLVDNCYQCHSAKAASEGKLKGGLQLDTREGARRGGESGPAVVPGKPDESLLISALKQEEFEMPPKGKLPDSLIGHFVKWIEMGAPDPREGETIAAAEIDFDAAKEFWSFRRLQQSDPPAVKDTEWTRTPIDQFIRARQEAAGVTPNPMADPRTLVRRAYYDLVGLPPAPEEVEAFVEESTRNPESAFENLIDHLLDSEHFGERWGRHWLDLVRFAESNGYAFDKDRPNAYHYRDFVIRALNADMPYDQFVRQQIAGDLLADADVKTTTEAEAAVESLAATGFLVAGPFTTQQTQKERERSRYEQLDDMIHTLGTSMLGLTVGCARCHSHKYDPLPQHDYYRFASCFSEVGFSDAGINMDPESFQKEKSAFDKAHEPLVAALAKFEQEVLLGLFDEWLKRGAKKPKLPLIATWHHIGPFASDSFDMAFDEAFPPEKEIDLAKTYQDGKLKWTQQPTWQDGTVHNTLTGDNSANYLYRVIDSTVARKISLSLGSDDAIKVWFNGKELLKNKTNRGAAPDQEKVELPLKNAFNQLLIKIVNGTGPSGFYFKSTISNIIPADVEKLLATPPDNWDDNQRKKVFDWFKTLNEEWLKLSAAVEEHKKSEPKPKLTNIYAAKVRGSTYNFGGDTYNVYFLSRGNADNKQGLAEPGFLHVLMDESDGSQHWLGAADSQSKTEKPARIALAEWLTDTEHGAGHLLARVIVNRLWQHHFGRGIVATPNDFGTRGERPSHPELLDWLAGELIRGGWRLKPIHKLIMTSAVYMQAGGASESGAKHDPENLLWWRRESRRLEAEAVRDALLAVSGTLDPAMYGPGTLDQNSRRRSVYFTVKRSQLIPMLQLFDAPDAMQGVGSREESTVAPQALALLNSPIVRGYATKLAERVRPTAETSIDDAITSAYQIALSRPPSDAERSSMADFIQRQTESRGTGGNAEALAVRDFCHVLLCMNEFVYVD